jgi:hypothetical protein
MADAHNSNTPPYSQSNVHTGISACASDTPGLNPPHYQQGRIDSPSPKSIRPCLLLDLDELHIAAYIEDLLRKSCSLAGVEYRGVQNGFGSGDLCLFSPRNGILKGSTLAISVSEATPRGIALAVTVKEIQAKR